MGSVIVMLYVGLFLDVMAECLRFWAKWRTWAVTETSILLDRILYGDCVLSATHLLFGKRSFVCLLSSNVWSLILVNVEFRGHMKDILKTINFELWIPNADTLDSFQLVATH